MTTAIYVTFQSPMGIGITSNASFSRTLCKTLQVSIPNGDRHYLEQKPARDGESRVDCFNPQWG